MKSRFAVAFIFLGLSLAPLSSHSADKPADKPTPLQKVREVTEDTTLTTKVKGEFAKDKTVSALNIHVETSNGVVTLSGNAKTREEAEKAVTLAKSTSGVSSVKNEIKVGTPKK